jgi:uncharacterized protein
VRHEPTIDCPKCVAPMKLIERNGIVIERCQECGGIFLDRGELEHLTQAEARWHDPEPASASAPRNRAGWHNDDDDDDTSHQGKRRKRRGFLDDLLDFG